MSGELGGQILAWQFEMAIMQESVLHFLEGKPPMTESEIQVIVDKTAADIESQCWSVPGEE